MSSTHIRQPDHFANLPPFKSKEERFVSEALQRAAAPEAAARMIRPWVGMEQLPLFRPKYGYANEAVTIEQVLTLDRTTEYNTNYTGGAWDINASAARNTGPGWL